MTSPETLAKALEAALIVEKAGSDFHDFRSAIFKYPVSLVEDRIIVGDPDDFYRIEFDAKRLVETLRGGAN